MTRVRPSLCLLACAISALLACSEASAQPITAANEEARFNYPVAGTAEQLLTADDATFAAFAAEVRADLDWGIAAQTVTDRTALRGLLSVRLALQMLSGAEDKAALATLGEVRSLQDKPDAKLLTGIELEALLKARLATGRTEGPQLAAAYEHIFRESLKALPWPVVGARVREIDSGAQLASKSLVLGEAKSDFEPALAKSHQLSGPLAWKLVTSRLTLRVLLPVKAQTLAALDAVVATHAGPKPDIWPAREVTLTEADRLTPVRVAIWDSGADTSLFPGRVYTDPSPAPMFDAHGLAFDLQGFPTHGDLYPLDPQRIRQYSDVQAELKGFSDLQAAVQSPEADALKHSLSTMPADQLAGYLETLEFFADYVHGTHVAGIAARGNPAIRLVIARMTFDWRNVPQPPTEELERRAAADFQTFVSWFRQHGVRVVNMSWGETPDEVSLSLEKNGVGKDVQERLALARKLFLIDGLGLYQAIRSAPDILFICSAGNADANSDSIGAIPAAFKLPNLLTVGAVDQAGEEASFTNYGDTVVVDADGYQVESVLPGGAKMRLSGTSMASPNVANLAAKLLAVDPKLSPQQLIRLIVDGASVSADGRRRNIDPRRSFELLRDMRRASTN